jgi:hypothetical protein
VVIENWTAILAFLTLPTTLARCPAVSYTAVQMLNPRELSSLATALGGLPVLGCSQGSPAADAGLCYGDIILAGDGAPVPSWSALLDVCGLSTTVALRVQRGARELLLPLRAPTSLTPRGVLGEPSPLSAASGRTPEEERVARSAADLC